MLVYDVEQWTTSVFVFHCWLILAIRTIFAQEVKPYSVDAIHENIVVFSEKYPYNASPFLEVGSHYGKFISIFCTSNKFFL